MNENRNRQHLNHFLRALADVLDVPPSKYQDAKDHYDAVGDWLGKEDSDLALYEPVIYPQGSFALGTAVRPLGDDDYDVDAVCLLKLESAEVTQQRLKAMVGDRLKHEHSRYKEMIDPKDGGRRCWTIKYADASKFHLDVLPAIPDDFSWLIASGLPPEWAENAICLTDRVTWNSDPEWPRSNPKGYAEWFKHQMRFRLEEAKAALAMEMRADVEQIEDFKVRTPLQRVIQLLKRHRDLRYNGDKDEPISIIITTLAAQAYDNESGLAEAILNVVPGMRNSIERRSGVWWVPNPVNPLENFADKWGDQPRKAALFFEWLDAVEQEHRHLLTDQGIKRISENLAKSYGQRDVHGAIAKFTSRQTKMGRLAAAGPVVLTPRKSRHAATPQVELPAQPSKPWSP